MRMRRLLPTAAGTFSPFFLRTAWLARTFSLLLLIARWRLMALEEDEKMPLKSIKEEMRKRVVGLGLGLIQTRYGHIFFDNSINGVVEK